MASKTRIQLENWLKTISVLAGRSVLDIGGSQLPIKKRIQPSEGSEFLILDLENPHEKKVDPDIIIDLNFDSPFLGEDNKTIFVKDKFDVAFCIEVSEYWWNPVNAMQNIYYMLKPGGILYISFHFIYPHHNPEYEDCLRYTAWGVNKLLKNTGFQIEEKIPRILETPQGNIGIQQITNYEGMRRNTSIPFDHIGYLVKAIKG